MAGRKKIIETRNNYASILAKLEGGESSINIGDMRQVLKLVVYLEAVLIKANYKSALLVLRREAVQRAKTMGDKEHGHAKTLFIK